MDTPEKELWFSEEHDDDFEAFYASILEEFGEKPQEKQKKPVASKPESPKARPVKPSAAVNAYADRQKAEPPVQKEKGIGALVVLVILELMGITGVAVWWIMHLL